MKPFLPATHYLLPSCCIILLLGSCAQVVRPTGGPKDVTPPKAVSYSPPAGSAHFNSTKIYIGFDEYVQIKNLSDQLIISPPLKRHPDVKLRGKGIEITLHDTLLPNTTYTFNFGNSISDLHEGNILKNFQYVFSTGDYLDSIKLKGKVYDAFTGESLKQASVLLFSDFSDSSAYHKRPAYCGLTDDNGNYLIEHLKPGTYSIVSLFKCTTDYFYHPGIQNIGFGSEPLELTNNDSTDLYLFKEEEKKLHLIKTRGAERGKIMLVFNKPADSLAIIRINNKVSGNEQTLLQYSVTGDTVNYWFTQTHLDSLRFMVSRNGISIDTGVVYSFPAPAKQDNTPTDKAKKKPPPSLRITTNINAQGVFDFHQPVLLQFVHPIAGYDRSKIILLKRKDTLAFTLDTSHYPFYLLLTPAKTFESDSSYKLAIYPGAFNDIFGLTNDTLIVHFNIQESTWFGTLNLSVEMKKKGNYILQLLDAQNNVFRQHNLPGTGSIFYEGLPPGTYRLRIIDDRNKNGKWDPGDYVPRIQPEKIYYYPESIQIRSNWDLTQEWKVKQNGK